MDDSSENLGGTEECSSNESGWTMYIASPIHENNSNNDDYNDDNDVDDDDDDGTARIGYKDFHDDDGGDGESDDSMASDASSGPSHQGGPCGTIEERHGRVDSKHAGVKEDRKSSGKKSFKQVEKKLYAEETKSAKEEQEHKGKSASGNAHTKGKSRK